MPGKSSARQCGESSVAGGEPHHALQDVLTEDVLFADPQDHVLVVGEDYGSEKLQAALWKVHIQDGVLGVKLSKASLQKPCAFNNSGVWHSTPCAH